VRLSSAARLGAPLPSVSWQAAQFALYIASAFALLASDKPSFAPQPNSSTAAAKTGKDRTTCISGDNLPALLFWKSSFY
jgi:hypothetical protein